MSAAQAHSEYMAKNNIMSHTGAGGSSPKSRAVGAGYGGGKTVFVSENIALGTNMTAQGAVNIWQGDSLHLSTMLSSSYQDVGAGVAVSGNIVYYALEAGNISGSAQAVPTSAPLTTPDPVSAPTATVSNSNFIQPVIVATPLEDGSIVHVVSEGQTLSIIAKYYEVPLDQILALNNLTLDSLIFPGEKLLIREAQEMPTNTPAPTPSPTQTPPATATSLPTASQTPIPTQTATENENQPAEAADTDSASSQEDTGSTNTPAVDPQVMTIIAMIVVGVTLVLLGSLMRKRA